MKTRKIITTGNLRCNESYEGETIEEKVDRITSNKEPITDGAPLVYTERKYGIMPAYDIRTDRWDIAMNAMNLANMSKRAKRDEMMKPKEEPKNIEETA